MDSQLKNQSVIIKINSSEKKDNDSDKKTSLLQNLPIERDYLKSQ